MQLKMYGCIFYELYGIIGIHLANGLMKKFKEIAF